MNILEIEMISVVMFNCLVVNISWLSNIYLFPPTLPVGAAQQWTRYGNLFLQLQTRSASDMGADSSHKSADRIPPIYCFLWSALFPIAFPSFYLSCRRGLVYNHDKDFQQLYYFLRQLRCATSCTSFKISKKCI